MFILLVGTFIWLSNGDRDPGYERCTQYAEMMEVDSKYDMDNHWCFVKVNDQWVEVEP
jgi:hypothetical protein